MVPTFTTRLSLAFVQAGDIASQYREGVEHMKQYFGKVGAGVVGWPPWPGER